MGFPECLLITQDHLGRARELGEETSIFCKLRKIAIRILQSSVHRMNSRSERTQPCREPVDACCRSEILLVDQHLLCS